MKDTVSHISTEAHESHGPRAHRLFRRIFLLFTFSTVHLFTLSTFLSSCSQAENLYDSWRVYFVVQNTNTIDVLNAALTGMGEFCTAVKKGNTIEYTNLKKTTPVNLTALDQRRNYLFGRGTGFVIGHTSLISSRFPDQVVCYDAVCSNCYENYSINRNVQLLSGSRAQCSSCQRIYDLNELGMVAQGEAGRSLYRYRVRYTPFQLVVDN